MSEPTEPDNAPKRASRRRFLTGAAGLAAASAAGVARADDKNLPPNVAGWSKQLGDGVGVRAYGNPSKIRKGCGAPHGAVADGHAGIVRQLHAAA